jgi:hypothetical protein
VEDTTVAFNFFKTPLPQGKFAAHESLPGFETLAAAKSRRSELIRILSAGDEPEQELVKILSRCKKDSRCLSAADPVCQGRYRIWFGATAARLIARDDADWTAISIVPSDLIFPMGALRRFNPFNFKDRIRKQIERGELATASGIGGIDFAVQHFIAGKPPIWRPHAYLLIRCTPAQARTQFEGCYEAGPRTPRPLMVRRVNKDEVLKATTYAFKSVFRQRMPSTDSKGNADTSYTDLTESQWSELAPLLHEWDYGGRLILRGLRRKGARLRP